MVQVRFVDRISACSILSSRIGSQVGLANDRVVMRALQMQDKLRKVLVFMHAGYPFNWAATLASSMASRASMISMSSWGSSEARSPSPPMPASTSPALSSCSGAQVSDDACRRLTAGNCPRPSPRRHFWCHSRAPQVVFDYARCSSWPNGVCGQTHALRSTSLPRHCSLVVCMQLIDTAN